MFHDLAERENRDFSKEKRRSVARTLRAAHREVCVCGQEVVRARDACSDGSRIYSREIK